MAQHQGRVVGGAVWLLVAGVIGLGLCGLAGGAEPVQAGISPVPEDPTPIRPALLPPLTDALPAIALNLDFSEGRTGEEVAAWIIPTPGYRAQNALEGPMPGLRAARFEPIPSNQPAMQGVMAQGLAPWPYAGEVVEVTAWLRVEPTLKDVVTAAGQLWLRAEKDGGQVGFVDGMVDRPVRAGGWRKVRVIGRIDKDAIGVTFGVASQGAARVYVADVRVRAIKGVPADLGSAPASALSDQGSANIESFARVLGMVRYFHPTDEMMGMDWEQFTYAGIERVEGCQSPGELRDALAQLFEPIAPTIQLFVATDEPPPAPVQPLRSITPNVTGMRYVGYAVDDSPLVTPFSFARLTYGAQQSGRYSDMPKPTSLAERTLPGGVKVRVPTIVWADAKGRSYPVATRAVSMSKPERPDGWYATYDDRTVRLAAVIATWNVFRHFYPYWDLVNVDWALELRPALQAAATARGTPATLRVLQRLVSKSLDGQARVVHAQERAMSAIDVGWTFVGDQLVVTRVPEKWASQIKPGDLVVAIDGMPVRQAVESLRPRISAATPEGLRQQLLTALQTELRTPDEFALTLSRPGDAERAATPWDVAMTRVPIVTPDERLEWMNAIREKRPLSGEEVVPGVVYVNMETATPDDLRSMQKSLEEAKGIVLDMRCVPGEAARLLLAHLTGDILDSQPMEISVNTAPDTFRRTGQPVASWEIKPQPPRLNGSNEAKVAFITDGRALGFAEQVLSIASAYRLGEIVGERTAGTTGDVAGFRVPGGAVVTMTSMRVNRHDNQPFHGSGVRPTMPVSRTQAGIAAGTDELLEAAVKAVSPGK